MNRLSREKTSPNVVLTNTTFVPKCIFFVCRVLSENCRVTVRLVLEHQVFGV